MVGIKSECHEVIQLPWMMKGIEGWKSQKMFKGTRAEDDQALVPTPLCFQIGRPVLEILAFYKPLPPQKRLLWRLIQRARKEQFTCEVLYLRQKFRKENFKSFFFNFQVNKGNA